MNFCRLPDIGETPSATPTLSPLADAIGRLRACVETQAAEGDMPEGQTVVWGVDIMRVVRAIEIAQDQRGHIFGP